MKTTKELLIEAGNLLGAAMFRFGDGTEWPYVGDPSSRQALEAIVGICKSWQIIHERWQNDVENLSDVGHQESCLALHGENGADAFDAILEIATLSLGKSN